MDYAYPEGTVGYVDIEADIDDTYITFVLSDSGMPFDPTQKEEVDTTLPAEQRKIGGLGIHLVRRIMDSVSYEYKDNKNILTLRKKFLNNK
jgi:sigma-B regulation protein RsbU (phosphoserine phosphatase)